MADLVRVTADSFGFARPLKRSAGSKVAMWLAEPGIPDRLAPGIRGVLGEEDGALDLVGAGAAVIALACDPVRRRSPAPARPAPQGGLAQRSSPSRSPHRALFLALRDGERIHAGDWSLLKEALPRNTLTPRTPLDPISCYARRPGETAPLSFPAPSCRTALPPHPCRKQDADLP